MVLLTQHPDLSRHLVMYLTLFRSATRKLEWHRSLKLANEVLQIGEGPRMNEALYRTHAQLRAKDAPFKPLSNHNYLKSVYADTPVSVVNAQDTRPPTPTSKAMGSLKALEELKRDK